MKLGIEFAGLLIFLFCVWTALKALIHLRNEAGRIHEDHEAQMITMEERKKLGRTA